MALTKKYSEIKKLKIKVKIEGLMSFQPKLSIVQATKMANSIYKQELKMMQECGLTEQQMLDSYAEKLTGKQMYDKFIKYL